MHSPKTLHEALQGSEERLVCCDAFAEGALTRATVRGVLGVLSCCVCVLAAGYETEEAGHMFDMVDLDHGGTVSLDEFAAWWLSDSHKATSAASATGGGTAAAAATAVT